MYKWDIYISLIPGMKAKHKINEWDIYINFIPSINAEH